NFLRAKLEKEGGGYAATFAKTRLPLSERAVEEAREKGSELEKYAGEVVVLGIRPEHIEDAEVAEELDTTSGNVMEVEPQVIESMGSEKYLYFGVGEEQEAHLQSVSAMTDDEDDEDGGGSPEGSGDLMVARISPESRAAEGKKVQLALDADQIRLFDPNTEDAIL
ncbi:MAG: hypothetical protein ACFB50_14070, partial [Rubrobacteraceae bacterium]